MKDVRQSPSLLLHPGGRVVVFHTAGMHKVMLEERHVQKLVLGCGLLAGMGFFAAEAHAIVIAAAPGATAPLNNTAPADDPGWDRVGMIGAGTGVYVGNGWVLTAAHVVPGSTFTLNGQTYNLVPGTGQILQNPGGQGLTAQSDLWIGQFVPALGSDPLPAGVLPISASTPSVGTFGTMVGTGWTQTSQTETTFWRDNSPNPDDWDDAPFAGADDSFNGFYRNGPRDKRWAISPVGTINGQHQLPMTIEGRDQIGFGTIFQDVANGGIVSTHDSGSPFFVKNGDTWELAGIAHALLPFEGQSEDPDIPFAVVYGNATFYGDLSVYADQINALVVPEPAGMAMFLLAAPQVLRRRGRRS
jgi:hypothetical protein